MTQSSLLGISERDRAAIIDPLDLAIKSGRLPIEKLRGARVLLTGGTGFFGSWLLEWLLRANAMYEIQAEAIVLTRSSERFYARHPRLAGDSAISLLEGDVRTFDPPAGFGYLIHAAFDSTALSGSIPLDEERDIILRGTEHCLKLAAEADVQCALFVSSGAVYGQQIEGVDALTEDLAECAVPSSRTNYGESKWQAEELCRAYAKNGAPVTVARCFAFVGPWLPLNAHFAIGNFIRDALRGVPIEVAGDGTPFRSYMYMSDLSQWLWTILCSGAPGCSYNVGSDVAVTIAEIAKMAAGLRQPALPVIVRKTPAPGQPAARYVPDTTRASEELGLTSTVTLSQAIRLTKEWYDTSAGISMENKL